MSKEYNRRDFLKQGVITGAGCEKEIGSDKN